MVAEALVDRRGTDPLWGVQVRAADLAQATELVVRRGLGGAGGYACFCNVHVLVTAQHSESLCRALDAAALVFADGWPVAWLQRTAGAAAAERIAGADLMARVFELGQAVELRHFLFGSTPNVLDQLRQQLLRRFPDTRIVGALAPAMATAHAEELGSLSEIRAARPHLVWCALGAPKQELWMQEHADSLAPAFVLGVGAAFEFLAGTKRRAPQHVQDAGLEWLHRLLCEPRRLAGRYVRTNAEFIGRVLFQAFRERMAP